MVVRFYDSMEESRLKFAVIIAKYQGKYVLCKHKERNTLEVPGGRREVDERIEDTARKELMEETGAIDFEIRPICVYSVYSTDSFHGIETFGKLYYAEIKTIEQELHYEIEEIFFMDELPTNWTYAQIQPLLIEEAKRRGVL